MTLQRIIGICLLPTIPFGIWVTVQDIRHGLHGDRYVCGWTAR